MRKYLCAEWFYTCKENDIQTGAQIWELILQRDSIEKWILDPNECTDIINNLCTEWWIYVTFTIFTHLFLPLHLLLVLLMYCFMYE